jgi:hypothetical protein
MLHPLKFARVMLGRKEKQVNQISGRCIATAKVTHLPSELPLYTDE